MITSLYFVHTIHFLADYSLISFYFVIQLRYQREIERLEKENKALKKSLLLRGDKNAVHRKEKASKN